MSKKIIVGNWKMNPANLSQAKKIIAGIRKYANRSSKADVIICPPFVHLSSLSGPTTKLKFGAQDLFSIDPSLAGRAFTGQISAEMLSGLDVSHVILGHSEKRALGETSEEVNKKIKIALKYGIRPIVCIGEKERHEDSSHFNFIKEQIKDTFKGIQKNYLSKIIVAYEPIWAIGSKAKREATTAESVEMAIFIKKVFSDLTNPKTASQIKILYGGSVNAANAGKFLEEGGVDGLLVGRESLEPDKFGEIIKIANQ
jgi:triosephosphate isomerase